MRTIKRKSLLYKSGVEYADFSLNHVEGCAHGCRYQCYAMVMAKRFGRVKSYQEWIKPKIVGNALELLDKEIPKYKDAINFVHLSFMTDPFMYGYTEVETLTLEIIARLNRDNIRCTVLTKGVYPKQLSDTERFGNKNEYGITLVSLDKGFKERFEPYSAPFAKRIEALRYLHDKGLKTWVSIEPYPTPNIVGQDLKKILDSVAFVDKLVFGKLNYNVRTSEFAENQEFYKECAGIVAEFCKAKGIEYHIKYGTQKDYNAKTEVIFSDATPKPLAPQQV